MVAICRGGDGCDCEEYDPPADPNVPSKCQECGHGKSKHPKPSEAPAAPAKTKKSVLDIFQSKTAKTLAQAIPVLSSRTSAGVGYAEAREESLKGYREDEKGRPKPGATKTSKKPDDKAKGSVQIAKVILLPCGSIARRNGQELREDTVPTGVDIAHMKNHGCVASNIQINPDWTHEECTQRFTHLFPEQFAFAHENAKSNDAASWSLVSKERQRVRCVPEGRPSGEHLVDFKTDKKSGPVYIYITLTGKRIPDELYATWYTGPALQSDEEKDARPTQPILVDSDSESDSNYSLKDDSDAESDNAQRAKKRGKPGDFETKETVKKQKIDRNGKSRVAETASKESEKLFLGDSDSASEYGFTRSILAGPSHGPSSSMMSSNSRTSTNVSRKSCSCRKVSAPPAFITPEWDTGHVAKPANPWSAHYNIKF